MSGGFKYIGGGIGIILFSLPLCFLDQLQERNNSFKACQRRCGTEFKHTWKLTPWPLEVIDSCKCLGSLPPPSGVVEVDREKGCD